VGCLLEGSGLGNMKLFGSLLTCVVFQTRRKATLVEVPGLNASTLIRIHLRASDYWPVQQAYEQVWVKT
jgi:hypothetical protein